MPTAAEKRATFRKLHAQGRFVISNPWDVGSARYLQGLGFKALATTGGAQGRAQLREEFRHAIGELTDAFGAEIAALERRLKAVPGRLPVAKDWIQESVTYQAEFVWRALASAQGHRTGPRRLGLGLRRTRWP